MLWAVYIYRRNISLEPLFVFLRPRSTDPDEWLRRCVYVCRRCACLLVTLLVTKLCFLLSRVSPFKNDGLRSRGGGHYGYRQVSRSRSPSPRRSSVDSYADGCPNVANADDVERGRPRALRCVPVVHMESSPRSRSLHSRSRKHSTSHSSHSKFCRSVGSPCSRSMSCERRNYTKGDICDSCSGSMSPIPCHFSIFSFTPTCYSRCNREPREGPSSSLS